MRNLSSIASMVQAVLLIALVTAVPGCIPDDGCEQTATCPPPERADASVIADAQFDVRTVAVSMERDSGSPDAGESEPESDAGPETGNISDDAKSDAPVGCVPGTTRKCADDPEHSALGNCAGGSETCTAGTWGPCSVQPLPADACTAGDDANCNGTKNDGCPCVDGTKQPCGPASEVGACRKGTQTCASSKWGECVGAVTSKPRDCTSALDNDCDGTLDNKLDAVCACSAGAMQECGPHAGKDGKGPCHAGTQTCVMSADRRSSAFGTCTGAVGPAATDTCELNNDNNCNGTPNDGCACVNGTTQPCGPPAAIGICKRGTQTCAASKWGDCSGAVLPSGRDCGSTADNDCNGTNDSLETACKVCALGTTSSCTADAKGLCANGSKTCVLTANKSAVEWGPCVPAAKASADNCNPPNDANCNGVVGENCCATTACGTTCCPNKPNTKTECSGSQCQYKCEGYTLSCSTLTQPSCGSWDFGKARNAPDNQGWYLDTSRTSPGASTLTASGSGISASLSRLGTEDGASQLEFAVNLCPGTLSADIAAGAVVSATITLHTATGSLPYAYGGASWLLRSGGIDGYPLMELKEGSVVFVGRSPGIGFDTRSLHFSILLSGDWSWSGTVTLSDVKIEPTIN